MSFKFCIRMKNIEVVNNLYFRNVSENLKDLSRWVATRSCSLAVLRGTAAEFRGSTVASYTLSRVSHAVIWRSSQPSSHFGRKGRDAVILTIHIRFLHLCFYWKLQKVLKIYNFYHNNYHLILKFISKIV